MPLIQGVKALVELAVGLQDQLPLEVAGQCWDREVGRTRLTTEGSTSCSLETFVPEGVDTS